MDWLKWRQPVWKNVGFDQQVPRLSPEHCSLRQPWGWKGPFSDDVLKPKSELLFFQRVSNTKWLSILGGHEWTKPATRVSTCFCPRKNCSEWGSSHLSLPKKCQTIGETNRMVPIGPIPPPKMTFSESWRLSSSYSFSMDAWNSPRTQRQSSIAFAPRAPRAPRYHPSPVVQLFFQGLDLHLDPLGMLSMSMSRYVKIIKYLMNHKKIMPKSD